MKKFIQKVRAFMKDRRGIVIPEYMMVAITVLIVAGIIGVGYATHLNSQASTTTTQMDSSLSNAQSKALALPQP